MYYVCDYPYYSCLSTTPSLQFMQLLFFTLVTINNYLKYYTDTFVLHIA